MIKKRDLLFVLLFLTLFLISNAEATIYYVRQGASGSGTSWNNAWGSLSSINWNSINPGDTICVSGGTYGTFSVDKSGTANARITIKRATTSNECNTGSGWSDSQVIINQPSEAVGIFLWQDYVTLDGQTDNGIILNIGSGTAIDSPVYGIHVVGNGNEIKYIKIVSPRVASNRRGITLGSSSVGIKNGFTLSHCEIDGGTDSVFLAFTNEILVEYCKFHDTAGSGAYHDNIAYLANTNNGIWRYNEQWGYTAEGLYFASNCFSQDNWHVYGNIFRDTAGSGRGIEFDSVCYGGGSNGIPSKYGPNWFIYNNLFMNLALTPIRSESSRDGLGGVVVSGGYIYNNLFINVPSLSAPGFTVIDYNWYSGSCAGNLYNGVCSTEPHSIAGGTTNPFSTFPQISSTIGSQYPRDKGLNLGASYYSTDPAGHTRGADGKWDIGAFEYFVAGPANGVCGTTLDSCSSGQFSQVADTTTQYLWRCLGTGGSTVNADCSMNIPTVNGACGAAAKTYTSSETFPSGAYCSAGTTNPQFPSNPAIGGTSNWQCVGTGGGLSAGCSATRSSMIYPLVSFGTTLPISEGTPLVFNLTTAGTYKLQGLVTTYDGGTNSFYVDIDTPTAGNEAKSWHIIAPITNQLIDVSWSGVNSATCYQYSCAELDPKTWTLTKGIHTLYVDTREAGTVITSITFVNTATGVNYHPADTNNDLIIMIDEYTGYRNAWRGQLNWPIAPSPPSDDYHSRALFLWKTGESYVINSSTSCPPDLPYNCWIK